MEYYYKYKDVLKLCHEIFGEDRVDGKSIRSGTGEEGSCKWNIVILFPEIEIVNANDVRRKLKQLFFKISLERISVGETDEDCENDFMIDLYGTRRTYNEIETFNQYSHSHLSKRAIFQYSSFCTGASTFQILVEELKHHPTMDKWYLFLYSIENYLSWESLEGGPYVRMDSLTLPNQVDMRALKGELSNMITYIPRHLLSYTTLNVNSHSTDFYDFCNKHSSIRDIIGANRADQNNWYAEKQREIINASNADNRNNVVWRGKVVPYTFEYDEIGINRDELISPMIVEKYGEILTDYLSNYSNLYSYEQSRNKNRNNTFRMAGAL